MIFAKQNHKVEVPHFMIFLPATVKTVSFAKKYHKMHMAFFMVLFETILNL